MFRQILFFVLILIPGILAGEEGQKKYFEKPNIIFILADDLGYGDLSTYGQTRFQTPNIDRLAREGMKFTQMYAGCTVCAPSRCSLMTGYHTGHTYIRGNGMGQPFGDTPIPESTVTLPKLLRQAGYKVGVFGKWGLGCVGNSGDPNLQGVDHFFGYYSQRDAHNYYPYYLHDNGQKIDLKGKTYSHSLIMDKGLQFIRDNSKTQFCCFFTVTIPHAAMQVPEQDMIQWRQKFPQFESVIGRYSFNTEVRNPVAAFPAMVTKLDSDVGRILSLLNELKIDEKTIVMFSSDNGPHHEGGHRSDYFNSNGPFSGYKRDLYEGGIREPFLVRWPQGIKPGSITNHVAAFWDILPTFMELTIGKTPQGLDGISFVPTLLGKDKIQEQHKFLYWEFHEQGGKRAVRFDHWKAIQLNVNKQPNGPVLLFDIDHDPGEEKDLASQYPELVEKAKKLFQSEHTPNEHWNFTVPQATQTNQQKKNQSKVKRPNIFFFFADDWGKYASIHRENKINDCFKTPAFDSLAQEGVRFTNAHVNAPTCTASRSSLFSGQYFYRTGFGAFLYAKQWDDSIPTFPLLLEKSGYHFGFSNKGWGPGSPANQPLGGKRNQYQKCGARFNQFSQNVTKMVEEGKSIEEARQILYDEVLGNFDDFLAKRKQDQPFCYYFGPTNTHRDWIKGSGKTLWNINPDTLQGRLPAFIPDVPEIREDIADYLGEVAAMDAVLALFVKKLKAMGELDNTVIVVSGDHGIPGFPRAKSNLYDIGTKVALLVRWGKNIKRNREITDFVSLMDLAPTFLEIAGLPVPNCMTGNSILPLLKSDQDGRIDPARDYVVTGRERHFMTARPGNFSYPSRALQTDDYLYIRNFRPELAPEGDPIPLKKENIKPNKGDTDLYGSPYADMDGGPTKTWLLNHYFDPQWQNEINMAFGYRPAEELYDLKNDPDCLNNLALESNRDKIRIEYGNRLTTILKQTRDPRMTDDVCIFDTPIFTDQWSKWRIPSPEDLRSLEESQNK